MNFTSTSLPFWTQGLFLRLAQRGGGGSRGFQPSESGLLLCLIFVAIRKNKRTVAGEVEVAEAAKDSVLKPKD